MLVTVLWRDAAIELEDEVTPENVQGQKDESQLLETVGWWLGVKEDQALLAIDRDPTHRGEERDRRHRWVYRIPWELVITVTEQKSGRLWKRGRDGTLPPWLMGRGALGSTRRKGSST
jgi:hypothetical protein